MKTEAITKQVFLSHVRKHKAIANALAKELQRQGFKVWSDQSILPGANWSEEITIALNESDSMIAILDQHSFSSSYVRNELQHAFFDDRYKNRLLPVLISPTSDTDFVRHQASRLIPLDRWHGGDTGRRGEHLVVRFHPH